ncbi:hypothetical protein COCVIDRAFT_116105 [Bipolaris victoriae FI3]|uniref:Uncharacterized protein n=1 Tax=Bipolaris victoriae (strain FI3) TaxID=930091 RepID=W7E3T9_BIPV3|nr:hypothetical protein COCVIDRAFT_116105 [Bipolaris victoriae FI3]
MFNICIASPRRKVVVRLPKLPTVLVVRKAPYEKVSYTGKLKAPMHGTIV